MNIGFLNGKLTQSQMLFIFPLSSFPPNSKFVWIESGSVAFLLQVWIDFSTHGYVVCDFVFLCMRACLCAVSQCFYFFSRVTKQTYADVASRINDYFWMLV